MANPSGLNQFQGLGMEKPGYGQVKKQFELTREAPVSGAPVAGRALNTPRRAQRQATHPATAQPQPQPQTSQPQVVAPPGALTPPVDLQSIAQIPGASPLVQELFGGS